MKNYLFIIFILTVALVAFLFRLNVENRNIKEHNGIDLIKSGESYSSTLKIKDDPENYRYSSKAIAQEYSLNRRVLILANGVNLNYIASVKVGDEIMFIGYLRELKKDESHYKNQHVVGVLIIEKVLSAKYKPHILEKNAESFRNRVISSCSNLDEDDRGLCEGILIGERQNIGYQTYENFKQSQLTHLVVASGSNIAFLIGFIRPLVANCSLRTRNLAIILLSLFYCCATRFEPSILRATVMVVVPLLALDRGYRLSSITAFISTLVGSLLIDPFLIYRVGFWLSLCASGGLIFLAPIIRKRIKSVIISNTLAATICVQPILFLVFGFRIPILWWASVIGVAIVEPLSTAGMVMLVAVSFISDTSPISQLIFSLFSIGTSGLLVLSKLATSSLGAIIGWSISIIILIAYTRNSKKFSGDAINNGRKKSYIYNR